MANRFISLFFVMKFSFNQKKDIVTKIMGPFYAWRPKAIAEMAYKVELALLVMLGLNGVLYIYIYKG